MLAVFIALAALAASQETQSPQSTQPSASQHKKAHEKPYALIFGTVYGPDNRARYGVPVKIRRVDKKKPVYNLVSDHNGEFAQRVPPGPADYLVWADIKAKRKKRDEKVAVKSPENDRTQVTVHVAGEERVDTSLHLNE